MRPPVRTGTLLFALAALLTACGDDAPTSARSSTDPATTVAATSASGAAATTVTAAATTVAGPAGTSSAAYPVTIKSSGRSVTLTTRPARIVSLSPTATEMLFAIGAGSEVAAVDANSNYPGTAPITALSGFEPNVEAIAGYQPDLVVLSNDASNVIAGLEQLKIPVLELPAASSLDDTYIQIQMLGTATAHTTEAATVVTDMKAKISTVLASVKRRATPLTYYHEVDNTFYSATSKTFIGAIYSLAGLQNIADAADTSASGGYPQLSPEYIVSKNPDLVFLADTKCCQQNGAAVASRPGWGTMKAVTTNSVVELDEDIASRWGPRIVDLLQTVVAAIAKVPGA